MKKNKQLKQKIMNNNEFNKKLEEIRKLRHQTSERIAKLTKKNEGGRRRFLNTTREEDK